MSRKPRRKHVQLTLDHARKPHGRGGWRRGAGRPKGRRKVAHERQRGKWARLRFVNDSARLHPIHLHGMFFKVLARDDVAVDEGFFRDTVLIHGGENIDIGLVPLDAGEWMMHATSSSTRRPG